jgi:hypothetical protein
MLTQVRWQAIIALIPAIVGCHDGGTSASRPPERVDSGSPEDAGPSPISYQVTEVTLRGPAAVVAGVTTTSLDRVNTSLLADGSARALFRSINGTDWTDMFSFTSSSSGSSTLSLRPWLCPRVPNAVTASLNGARALEQRLLDVDGDGRFWTNGELGDVVLSTCEYSIGSASGASEATFQDGPDLCADAARTGTQIEVLDAENNVLSRPVVCAAGFGLSRSAGYAGQICLVFEKDADDQDGIAFTAGINHCQTAGTTFPAVVTSADMLASRCAEEAVWFQVGVGGVQKPSTYPVSSGTWQIEAASPDRTTSHLSQIDLTFSSEDGSVTYSVRGKVALPQLLF